VRCAWECDAYIQEPIDVDFEQQVSELHRRARGSNGSG
jgi:hypothetical protein